MNATRAITVRLDPTDYDRLAAEAAELGMSPGTLARVYVRAGLAGNGEVPSAWRRRAALNALRGLSSFRRRLPESEPVDVVEIIRQGREELERRTGS